MAEARQIKDQHNRNIHAIPLQRNRGDKTPLELFLAGIRDWGAKRLWILIPESDGDH